MFVLSLKASTLKLAAALAALAVVVAAAFWEGGVARTAPDTVREAAGSGAAVSAVSGAEVSTNAQRVTFLKSLGWQVDDDPVEVVEVVIPKTFNAVYNNYNAIQKAQGFDLLPYRGTRAKRWTYNVKNYPGATAGVRANLLVYNGRLIGGDVSSVAINGFMQGLKPGNASTGISPSQADIVAETFKENTAD